MTAAKWIEFRPGIVSASQITKLWCVVNRQHQSEIGRIRWDTGWRRYVFAPHPHCIFEQDCLRDIAAFIETETREHKAARKAAK